MVVQILKKTQWHQWQWYCRIDKHPQILYLFNSKIYITNLKHILFKQEYFSIKKTRFTINILHCAVPILWIKLKQWLWINSVWIHKHLFWSIWPFTDENHIDLFLSDATHTCKDTDFTFMQQNVKSNIGNDSYLHKCTWSSVILTCFIIAFIVQNPLPSFIWQVFLTLI